MADQSPRAVGPRAGPEGFDQSSSPTVPRLNMLQTIPNIFLILNQTRFILWVISSVDNVGLSFGISEQPEV